MFIVYGRENCPYCVKAKNLLESKDLRYAYVYVNSGNCSFRKHMVEAVTLATGKAPETVPQIFDGDIYVGGFTDLEVYLNKEEEELHIEQFDL